MLFVFKIFLLSLSSLRFARADTCCAQLELLSNSFSFGGKFERNGEWGQRALYWNKNTNIFLYYRPMRVGGLWMVGPHIGEVGVLAQVGEAGCPTDIRAGSWQYRVGSSWLVDQDLHIRCCSQHGNQTVSSVAVLEIKASFTMKNINLTEKINTAEEMADLSTEIEQSLGEMLSEEKDISDQVEFKVTVEKILVAGAEVDFKIQYNIKDSFQAFEINPVDMRQVLIRDFQYRRGILFAKFPVDEDSFHCSGSRSVEDSCERLNCSHQCGYDYSREEFVCTCPHHTTLDSSNTVCTAPQEETTTSTTTTSSTTSTSFTTTPWCPHCLLDDGEVTTITEVQEVFETTTEAGTETTTEVMEGESGGEISTLLPAMTTVEVDREVSTLLPPTTSEMSEPGESRESSEKTNHLLPVFTGRDLNMTENIMSYGGSEVDITRIVVEEEKMEMVSDMMFMFDCVAAYNAEMSISETQAVLQCKMLDKEDGENILIVVEKTILSP